MPTRFAIANGNWSNTAIWDSNSLPTSADDVHANGFTVNIDQNINVLTLRNTASPVALVSQSIPTMTANNLPSGLCFGGGGSFTSTGLFNAFDQNTSTTFTNGFAGTTLSPPGTVGYQFTTGHLKEVMMELHIQLLILFLAHRHQHTQV